MFSPKQKLGHRPLTRSTGACFNLCSAKGMIAWVHTTLLLYQSWNMKVFCYFRKFLFTCRLTIWQSGVVPAHTMRVWQPLACFTAYHNLDVTFLQG
jgi:hypothetical protein